MQQNIQALVEELVLSAQQLSVTRVTTDNIIRECMLKEFLRLKASQEKKKQEKMIVVFMGGVILALARQDAFQGHQYADELYPHTRIFSRSRSITKGEDPSELEFMYIIGKLAMLDLPNLFCGGLFTRKVALKPDVAPMPFFPELATMTAKIDLLVAFCKQHPKDLERADFEYNKVPQYVLPENFVENFIEKHKESYQGGCFGRFFKRTNLRAYKKLTAKEILAHAKEKTFFGYENRTCKILKAMNVIDKDSQLVVSSIIGL